MNKELKYLTLKSDIMSLVYSKLEKKYKPKDIKKALTECAKEYLEDK